MFETNMIKLVISIFLVFVVLLVPSGMGCKSESGGESPFLDSGLEEVVRLTLDKSGGDITQSDLDSLTSLSTEYLWDIQIYDLTGLEYCTNLTSLDVSWEKISDISPIANLNKLTSLSIRVNPEIDLTPIEGLNNLTYLNLEGGQITDISLLANLDSLKILNVRVTAETDLSPLSGLTSLVTLGLGQNDIIDISAIASEVV